MKLNFRFEGTNELGQAQSGQVEAKSRADVSAQLLQHGWTDVRIEAVMGGTGSGESPLAEREVIELLEQLQSLTRSGLPLPAGLRAASIELESAALRETFVDLATHLEAGAGLDSVLLDSANRFPAHLQGLVRAGSRSGRLAEVLAEVIRGSNLGVELRRKIWTALAYPVVALSVILGLTAFICRVSSQIADQTYPDPMNYSVQPLPLTGSVVALTHFFAENDWKVLIGVSGLTLVGWLIWRLGLSPAARRRAFESLPLVGPLSRFIALAEFCQLVGLLVEAATPLPDAISLAGASVRNAALADSSRRVAAAMTTGQPLGTALQSWKNLPAGLGQLLVWGEGQQNLAGSFRFAGEMFEARSEAQATFTRQVLGSSLLLLMVCWLGFAVVSVYLPIAYSIQLISKLSG